MARLKRSDLSEEFSTIVKQEVKNHNDAILASNVSINTIKSEVDKTAKLFDRKIRLIQDSIFDQSLAIEDLKKNADSSLAQIKRDSAEKHKTNCDQLVAIKKSIDDRESYFLRIEGFNQFKEKLDQSLAKIECLFHTQRDNFKQDCFNIVNSNEKSIDEIRVHLRKKEDCDKCEKKLMEKNLDVFSIHHDGVKGELETIKKRLFIIEKNIENLHTRIDRMKGGV